MNLIQLEMKSFYVNHEMLGSFKMCRKHVICGTESWNVNCINWNISLRFFFGKHLKRRFLKSNFAKFVDEGTSTIFLNIFPQLLDS